MREGCPSKLCFLTGRCPSYDSCSQSQRRSVIQSSNQISTHWGCLEARENIEIWRETLSKFQRFIETQNQTVLKSNFFRHKKLLYLKAKQPIMSALTVQSISNQFRTVVGAGEGKRKLRLVLVSLLFEWMSGGNVFCQPQSKTKQNPS